MNYLLTYICPKNCSFCFFPTAEKNNNNEMTLETFKACFIHARRLGMSRRVALLGGEPTVAAHFRDIYSYIVENDVYVDAVYIFSNLMGTANIRWWLTQPLPRSSTPLIFIWNNSEFLDLPLATQTEVMDNAKAILARGIKVVCSLTMTPRVTIPSLRYLSAVKDLGIRGIRFALDSLWTSISEEQMSTLRSIDAYLRADGFSLGYDLCGSSYRIATIPGVNVKERCDGFCGDILPDGTVVPCMPWLRVKKRLRFTDVDNIAQAYLYYGVRPSDCGVCLAPARSAIFDA